MESEGNSRSLLAVRFALGAPLIAAIVFVTTIWSTITTPGSIQWIVSYSFTVFLCLLIIFLMARAAVPESFEEKSIEYYIEELLYQNTVYVIPTLCNKCKTPIELNKVRWEDERTLICQECQTRIKLRIVEK